MWADSTLFPFGNWINGSKVIRCLKNANAPLPPKAQTVKSGAYAIFQYRITFEPFDPIFKNESVLESAHIRANIFLFLTI